MSFPNFNASHNNAHRAYLVRCARKDARIVHPAYIRHIVLHSAPWEEARRNIRAQCCTIRAMKKLRGRPAVRAREAHANQRRSYAKWRNRIEDGWRADPEKLRANGSGILSARNMRHLLLGEREMCRVFCAMVDIYSRSLDRSFDGVNGRLSIRWFGGVVWSVRVFCAWGDSYWFVWLGALCNCGYQYESFWVSDWSANGRFWQAHHSVSTVFSNICWQDQRSLPAQQTRSTQTGQEIFKLGLSNVIL